MSRERNRPPQLESLETKQLLSTLTTTAKTVGANISRQTSATAIRNEPHLASSATTAATAGHGKIGQAAGAVGRQAIINSVERNFAAQGLTGRLSAGRGAAATTRLNLSAGLLGTVARSVATARPSVTASASLGSTRIGGGPKSTPLVTATVPPPAVSTPVDSAALAHKTVGLPANLL